MASFSDIAAGLTNASQTLGYDAIISISVPQLNVFLFDQYAANGPDTPLTTISAVVATEELTYLILDLIVGPPLLSFPNVGLEIQLQMTLTGGTITQVNLDGPQVDWVLPLAGGLSTLTGTFSLSASAGTENKLGQIVLNLGESLSWTAAIDGLQQESVSIQNIAAAVQAVYAQQPYTYQLGTILQPESLDPALLPTKFTFVGVPAGADSPGCLNIQVVTNGQGSEDDYGNSLVPDESTVGILLSASVIQKVLIDEWPALFSVDPPNATPTFAPQISTNGPWSLASSGGTIDIGTYDDPGGDGSGEAFSTNQDGGSAAPVLAPWADLIFTAGINLQITYGPSWTQWWLGPVFVSGPFGADTHPSEYGTATMQCNYQGSVECSIVQGTASVSFVPNWSGSVTGESEEGFWTTGNFGEIASGFASNGMSQQLKKVLSSLPMPQVNEFYLQSVLFPAGSLINLKQVLLPYDLYTAGSVSPALELSPTDVTVAPGGTVQFSVVGGGGNETTWSVLAPCGTITQAGLYSAPAKPNQTMVVVKASQVSGQQTVNGFAIVRITANISSDLTISPISQTLPSSAEGIIVTLNDPSATLSVDTDQGGVQNLGGGQWVFNAPEANEPTVVTLTASNDSGQQTQAQWMILPVDPSLTLTVSETEIAPGATLQVTASAKVSTVAWALCPTDASGSALGTLTANGMAATYTAPILAPNTPSLSVRIIAYSTDQYLAVAQQFITIKS